MTNFKGGNREVEHMYIITCMRHEWKQVAGKLAVVLGH
jgi:hypothetical protein